MIKDIKKIDIKQSTEMIEEILKPKSLQELYVMNNCKFPFEAIKIVSTGEPGDTPSIDSRFSAIKTVSVGTIIKAIDHSSFPDQYVIDGDKDVFDNTRKVWRLI